MESNQSTNTILMVRPAAFCFNEQTAVSNAFQSKEGADQYEAIQQAALREFDAMVKSLQSAGVQVEIVADQNPPLRPDAIFPNNWISMHANGRIYTYPMFTENRRTEVRIDVIDMIMERYGYNAHISLESTIQKDQFLEGTGSMILDRVHQIVYACLSPRTSQALLEEFAKMGGYTPVVFHARDQNGIDIYHTNVMMALGTQFVVICLDSIPTESEREMVLSHFAKTGHTVVPITFQQMNAFAGNMIELAGKDGRKLLVMSQTAYDSLTPDQIKILNEFTTLVPVKIDTIEKYGGGSARCMIAEIFPPRPKSILIPES